MDAPAVALRRDENLRRVRGLTLAAAMVAAALTAGGAGLAAASIPGRGEAPPAPLNADGFTPQQLPVTRGDDGGALRPPDQVPGAVLGGRGGLAISGGS